MYTLIVPLESNRVPDRTHSQFQETYYGEPCKEFFQFLTELAQEADAAKHGSE
jgi:hypothetical protein